MAPYGSAGHNNVTKVYIFVYTKNGYSDNSYHNVLIKLMFLIFV